MVSVSSAFISNNVLRLPPSVLREGAARPFPMHPFARLSTLAPASIGFTDQAQTLYYFPHMPRPQARTELENAVESSRRMFDYISSQMGLCDRLLANLATAAINKSAKSELTATLEALRTALGNMSGFVVELQHCLASAPAKAEFRFGAKAYRFSLEGIDILHDTFICFLHDLSHRFMGLDTYVSWGGRIPPDKVLVRDSSTLKWYVIRANNLINWVADVPISVEALVSEAQIHAGYPNDMIALSVVGAMGLVRGQFKLALKAVLAALGDGSSRNPSRMPHLLIVTSITNSPPRRQLQIAVTVKDQDDRSELCDAINGTFKPNTEGPFFDLYAAGRMLRDSGASISADRIAPQFVIVVPFPEVA
jgi:hypothetical protein